MLPRIDFRRSFEERRFEHVLQLSRQILPFRHRRRLQMLQLIFHLIELTEQRLNTMLVLITFR